MGRQHDSFGSGADGYVLRNVAFPSWAGAGPGKVEEALHPADMLARHAEREQAQQAAEVDNSKPPASDSSSTPHTKG